MKTPLFAFTLSMVMCLGARAELKWEQTSIELHPAANDKQAIGHFKYQNTGTTPVHFKSVHASCGCTTAQSQKDVVKGFPEWLQRVEVPKKDGTVHYPIVTDSQSLLWLVNQNSITPHVWISRAPDLLHPDICVFDLDPSVDDASMLRDAAVSLRDPPGATFL